VPGGVKNAAIALLLAAAVVQTCAFWFGGAPGFDGLAALFSKGERVEAEDALARLLEPYRVVSGDGGAESPLYARYNGIAQAPEFKAAEEALAAILRRGEFVGAEGVPDSGGAPQIVMEYGFSVPSDVFVKLYYQRSSLLTARVKQFDAAAVYWDERGVTAAFEDRARGTAWKYKVEDAAAAGKLAEALEEVKEAGMPLRYASVSGATGVLWPAAWDGAAFPYRPLTVRNPYGELTFNNLSRYMESFFEGSAKADANKSADGVYTFTNGRTTLYYYPSGVLEAFFSYQRLSDETVSSIDGCFAAALNALMKDTTLSGDIYLSGAEKSFSGAGYAFFWDQSVNDIPLTFSKDLRAQTGMAHMVEITVEKDSVKYRRYAADFSAEAAGRAEASKDYARAAGELGLDVGREVTGLELAYRVDGGGEAYLCWFINADGKEFAVSAE
jgi:hypothetical protein